MAWGDQGRSHYAYAAGSWSTYYWNSANNPGATFDLCMANCTTYAYGRVRENGLPAPVTQFRNANNWHNYVNTSGGWSVLNYSSGMSLMPGDIVEWSANHVAVVETSGTNPYVSGSWYTDDNGHATGNRSHSVMGFTLNEVSQWMISNYPGRFYHYYTLTSESSYAGGGLPPLYVLRCSSSPSGGGSPAVNISPTSYSSTMSANDNYIDFTFTLTVTGIPAGQSASGNTTFTGLTRISNGSGWQYTDYTYNGTTYRRAVKTGMVLRYTREHDYAYTTTKNLVVSVSYSNGSASATAPMNITVQKASTEDEQMIEIINTIKKRRKKWFYGKFY